MRENKMQNSKKPLKISTIRILQIILSIEVLLIITLSIVLIMKIANNNAQNSDGTTVSSDNEIQDPDNNAVTTTVCGHRTKENLLQYVENISKEEALSVIERQIDTKCFPDGLIPTSYNLRPDEFTRKILYSYDDPSEVLGIAQDSVMGLDDSNSLEDRPLDEFIIDEVTDYYTIVSIDPAKVSCGELNKNQSTISCYRGISFNRAYLNYYEEVDGSSHNDRIKFTNTDPEFAELALKIILASDIWNSDSLYDYYFEQNETNYTLTGIYFGVGLDMTNLENATASNLPYAINLYEKKLILDKESGQYSWERYSTTLGEGNTNTFRSFPLTDDELFNLTARAQGLTEEEKNELKEQYYNGNEINI